MLLNKCSQLLLDFSSFWAGGDIFKLRAKVISVLIPISFKNSDMLIKVRNSV